MIQKVGIPEAECTKSLKNVVKIQQSGKFQMRVRYFNRKWRNIPLT